MQLRHDQGPNHILNLVLNCSFHPSDFTSGGPSTHSPARAQFHLPTCRPPCAREVTIYRVPHRLDSTTPGGWHPLHEVLVFCQSLANDTLSSSPRSSPCAVRGSPSSHPLIHPADFAPASSTASYRQSLHLSAQERIGALLYTSVLPRWHPKITRRGAVLHRGTSSIAA